MAEVNHNSLDCNSVKNAFNTTLKQANLSYDLLMSKLENYTQTVFNDSHQNHHKMWLKKKFEWLFPNNEPLQVEEYDQEIPESAVQHLLSSTKPQKEQIELELVNLSRRLQILRLAIKNIRQKHEAQMQTLMRDYPTSYGHIDDFFKNQEDYIWAVITEIESSMINLHIEPPKIDSIADYKENSDLLDWIVTREHLKLLNYIRKVFQILLERCFEN